SGGRGAGPGGGRGRPSLGPPEGRPARRGAGPQPEEPALTTHTAVLTKPRGPKPPVKMVPAPTAAGRTIEGLAEVFRLLAGQSRLRILLALAQDGELHVSALCELLNQSQPAVSHHLTLLRMAGLAGYRREGKHNFYRVESGLIRDLLEQFFSDSGNGHMQLHFEDFSLSYKRK